MGSFIIPAGWDNWRDTANERTAFYAEYKSGGEGAAPGKRVAWSKQLTEKEAKLYSLEHVFGKGKMPLEEDWLQRLN
jgi:pectinesterase